MRESPLNVKRDRPAVWLLVVMVSTLAMVVLVLRDLRRTVDEQAARARTQARRDAEREAAALVAALVDPGALQRVPAAARFTLADADVVVPEDLLALDPRVYDLGQNLDAVAAERLRRTTVAPAFADALIEATPLLEDPAVPASTRARLRAALAWRAHREGLPTECDAQLAACAAPPRHVAAAASVFLLRATRAHALPPDVDAAALARALPATHAHALCESLATLHLDPTPLRLAAADAAHRRAVLRVARDLAPTLALASEPVARAVESRLVLYAPASHTGAILDREATRTLCMHLLGPAPTATLLLTSDATPPDAIQVVDHLLSLVPATPPRPGFFAGATGTALVIAALALLCGAGSAFAFRAQRRAAAAMRAREEFLTMVTHELKTPLAGVRLVGELLADGHVTDPSERAAWLARLNAEAARLGLLIENVLDLGRTERRERAHAPAPIDLAAFVHDTLALASPLLVRDGFAVHPSLPPVALVIDADADALRQALLNLLDNARKYGKSPIEVNLRRADAHAVVAVRDHGDGVPERERAAIFARFSRGSAHRHGGIPGVGLGLHLARAIAARHGGRLVYGVSSGGACFELWLPMNGHAEDPAT